MKFRSLQRIKIPNISKTYSKVTDENFRSDHIFNVDGLRKSSRKWRAMLKSVPMLGNVWLRANIIKTGVQPATKHKYSMIGVVCAPNQCGVRPGTLPGT
jgi:hypothetical protein